MDNTTPTYINGVKIDIFTNSGSGVGVSSDIVDSKMGDGPEAYLN